MSGQSKEHLNQEKTMYISDPVELMESRTERQMDLVDEEGKYPCCCCGVKVPVDELMQATPDPSSAGICYDCAFPPGHEPTID